MGILSVMSVPLTLLGLLERGPSHGYDLKRDYDVYFGRGRPLRYSQVYATLFRLARDGKAVAWLVEQEAGPQRRRYLITGAGIADVERWLAEPAPPEPDLTSELFAKVVLALMLGRPADSYLDAQRAAHLQRMRELTELKRDSDQIGVLLADHALYRLEADPPMDRPYRGPAGPARTGGATGDRRPWNCDDQPGAGPSPFVRQHPGTARRVADRSRPGEIVAVMGPSGSGKSTLLHCLAGILVPDQGEVWFGRHRLDTWSDDRRSALRRDRFGFVFQSGQLVPELTAEENVALPLLLSGSRRGPAMTAARRCLGLDGLEGRRSGELSGGQAQRVALARGLVAGPEMLFADEPTGLLDSVSGELVMELLTAAAREHGTTVVLVTHDARVAAYADREVVVRDGKVSTLTGATP